MLYFLIAIVGLLTLYSFVRYDYSKKYVLVFWNCILTFAYFSWRITVIPRGDWASLLLGGTLFAAELLGIIVFLSLQYLLSKEYKIKKQTLDAFQGELPSVDVFICTYNEPENLLETTILAALNLDYPSEKLKIYICDDGHRDTILQLANRCHINYLSREGNKGAKAGNLNYALNHSSGEFFAVLDADMVCSRDFITHTLGYFSNKKTAFVQTPQVYYNKDMYQRNLGRDIPNEQDFFMREIQEARACVNAVLHVGTNAIFRRAYILEIGMYPTTTITEDMAVGILLQEAGYDSIFINEMLVLGLTASTYTDLVLQRDRWCRGNLQVMKLLHPIRSKNLTLKQRLTYFNDKLYWYTSFQKLVFIFCPIWYLFTSMRSMNAQITGLLIFFLPYFIGQILTFQTLVTNTRSLKWAHYYEIAMAPHMCKSVIKELFSSKAKFSVTPKDLRDDSSYFQLQVIIPHMFLAGITLGAWLIGALQIHYGMMQWMPFVINWIWSFYNLIGIIVSIRVAYHIAGVEHMEDAIIENGYPALAKVGDNEFSVILTALAQNSIRCATTGESYFGEAALSINYYGEVQTFYGSWKPNGRTAEFIYNNLNLAQKKILTGLYVEHLRPSFDVDKVQQYF